MSLLAPDVLKALQGEYMKSFPEKIALIEKALKHEDWTALEREFHKFYGSGTTYKMPEISKIAKAIEVYLEKHVPPDAAAMRDAVALFKSVLESRMQGRSVDVEGHEAYKRIA